MEVEKLDELGAVEGNIPALEACVVPKAFADFPAGKSPDVSGAAGLGAAGVRTNEKEDAEVDERLFAHFNKPSDGGLEGKPPPGVTLLEAELVLTEGAEVELVLKAGAGVGTVLPGGGPKREASAGPDFSAKDTALLGTAKNKHITL